LGACGGIKTGELGGSKKTGWGPGTKELGLDFVESFSGSLLGTMEVLGDDGANKA